MFNKKRSWDTIAIIIFYADAFEKGVCPEARLRTNESLRITPFDNFIYLSTARILMKFTYLSEAPADFRNNYPVPCFPLRAGYVSRPELLESPEMKKKEEEDLILSQFVIDKSLSSMFRKKSIEFDSGSVPPLEDEFNKGLDKLLNEGVLSVSTVFAAQIYLDLQNIMGENGSKALDDLQTSTKEIDKIMNLKAVNDAWDVGGSGERWHSNDIEIVLRIKSTSLHWVLENHFTRFKELMLHQNPQDDDVTIPLAPAGKPSEPSRSPDKKGGIKSIATSTARPKPPKDPKFSNVVSHQCLTHLYFARSFLASFSANTVSGTLSTHHEARYKNTLLYQCRKLLLTAEYPVDIRTRNPGRNQPS